MPLPYPKDRGYSLIELLAVLTIVGILSTVGVATLSGRKAGGVRSIMDELEGVLMNAQKSTVVMSRDVYISTQGEWGAGTMILDARPFKGGLNGAGQLVVPSPPGAGDLTPGDNTKREGSDSECFRRLLRSRDHMSAGIPTSNQEGWYTIARGGAPDLAAVEPINGPANQNLVDALNNRLFKATLSSVVVNGLTKRFDQGFSVVVVGLAQGHPIPNGPVGVLVVPANSSSVYKFYKADGESTWRRL